MCDFILKMCVYKLGVTINFINKTGRCYAKNAAISSRFFKELGKDGGAPSGLNLIANAHSPAMFV